MRETNYALISSQVITPLQVIRDGVVLVEGGKISSVGRQSNIPIPEGYRKIDLGNLIIAPGFIDIHNHGGMGMTVSLDGEKGIKGGLPAAGGNGLHWLAANRKHDAGPFCCR